MSPSVRAVLRHVMRGPRWLALEPRNIWKRQNGNSLATSESNVNRFTILAIHLRRTAESNFFAFCSVQSTQQSTQIGFRLISRLTLLPPPPPPHFFFSSSCPPPLRTFLSPQFPSAQLVSAPGFPRMLTFVIPLTPKSNNFKFLMQPHHKYSVTRYEELGFSSLTRMKDDCTPKFSLPYLYISL